ncbi:MAG: hypothetical protein Kow006_10170 [Gammaproteobacteria bacterium]
MEYQRKAAELKRKHDGKKKQLHAKGSNVFGRNRLEGKIDSDYQAALSALRQESETKKKRINALKIRANQDLAQTGRISPDLWKQISRGSPGSSIGKIRTSANSALAQPVPRKDPRKKPQSTGDQLARSRAIPSTSWIASEKAPENKSPIVGAGLPSGNNPITAGTRPADSGKPHVAGAPGGGFTIPGNQNPANSVAGQAAFGRLPPANSRAARGVISNAPAGLGQGGTAVADDLKQGLSKEKGVQLARAEEWRPKAYVAITVECPVPYKVEVVSRVPEYWTPSFKSLDFRFAIAEVRMHNGQETLFCHYCGGAGCDDFSRSKFFTHQPAPPGHTCEAEQGHFRCRELGPYISDEGTVTLEPSQMARLRHGSSAHFVWWRADSKTVQYLEAVGRNKIRKVNHEPQPDECKQHLRGETPARYTGDNVRQGDIFCYRTYSGEYGRFRIIAERGRAPKTIVLHYRTWALP